MEQSSINMGLYKVKTDTSLMLHQNNMSIIFSEQLKSYKEDGFAVFRKFITQDRVDEMNSAIDSFNLVPSEEVFEENRSGLIKQIQYLHKRHPIFSQLVESLKPLAHVLLDCEEEELSVLNVQMFEKHPHISKETRAHQDNAYFKVKPARAMTFWLSLDQIDQENGALYYAPKTHLTPTRKHFRYDEHTTFRVRSGVPGLSVCLHEHPSETDLRINTAPGDLLVHHCNTVHRAGKNTSERRRRAIGVVFIPKSCGVDERLQRHFEEQLQKDIALQKVKDPQLYRELLEIAISDQNEL